MRTIAAVAVVATLFVTGACGDATTKDEKPESGAGKNVELETVLVTVEGMS